MPESSRVLLDRARLQEMSPVRTQGEIEAAVCDGVRRFETARISRVLVDAAENFRRAN